MNNKLLKGLTAATIAAVMALASPVLARGGGGGFGGGGFGGGGRAGGFGGGGHFGGGGMHAGGFGGTGGMHVGGMGGGAHFAHVGGPGFSGPAFGGARFAHAGFGPRFAGPMAAHAAFVGPRFGGAGWHGRPFIGRHAFFFRHHRRFAFFGAPFIYAGYYDGCWRRSWTPYGWQWVNVCGENWY